MLTKLNATMKALLKKTFLLLVLTAGLTFTADAQRIAFVDIQKVLGEIPAYQKAQEEIDRIAQAWRQEINQEYDKIKGLYNEYQVEQVLMSDEARRQKEEEIMNREQQVRDLQKKRFGPEGDLFKRRRELVQPIQDRVYSAIEEYAEERGFDFIFDKSGSAGMIYSNSEYDKTEDIIRKVK